MQSSCNENDRLREEIQNLTTQINELQGHIKELCDKYRSLRDRKDRKVIFNPILDRVKLKKTLQINKLKYERNALKDVHLKLIKVLEKQQNDIERNIINELKSTKEPVKALLLNEVI